MTINNTINDNDVVFGSLQITIGAQAYETTDFSLTPEVDRFVRKSSKNIPTGRVSTLGERTGTATLHRPSSGIAAPVFGDAFTVTVNSITYNCTVTKVGDTRTAAGEAMIPISFDVNIGTVVLSVQT